MPYTRIKIPLVMVIGHVRRSQNGITDRPIENHEEEQHNERHLLEDFRHRSKDEVDHKQANGCTRHRFKLIGQRDTGNPA